VPDIELLAELFLVLLVTSALVFLAAKVVADVLERFL